MSAPPEFEVLLKDIQAKHMVLVAERKHGKSTSLKTFIQFVKERLGNQVVIKVFDVSQSWYHCAPLRFRQYLTPQTLPAININDCVFEMGRLLRDDRRALVGNILTMDYGDRQDIKHQGGESAIKAEPLILYVFEEANTYFDSQSLNRKDDYSTILGDFVSVGRNYGLGGVLVVTRMKGELAPGIRERCNKLFGRITGSGELQSLQYETNKEIKEVVKSVARFHWVYWNGEGLGPFRIPDLVKNVPQDYVQVVDVLESTPQKKLSWMALIGWGLIGVFIGAMFFYYIMTEVFGR